mgnify:CR=1 FL=1
MFSLIQILFQSSISIIPVFRPADMFSIWWLHYQLKVCNNYVNTSGLNRVLRARCDDLNVGEDYNIFKHRRFRPFQLVYDGYVKQKQYTMKALTNTQADHLSEDDTARLLSVLGTSDPEQLLASLIFYTTYTFAIR